MTQATALPTWAKISIGITVLAAAIIFIFDAFVNEVTHQEIANRARENTPEEIKKRELGAIYNNAIRACLDNKTSRPMGLSRQQFCEAFAATQVLCKENDQHGGVCQ